MKILFSPSEAKREGGIDKPFDKNSFVFPDLYDKRNEILSKYKNFIENSDNAKLSKLFGIKDPSKFIQYKQDIYIKPTMKAIERYSGVAFEYLDYQTLTDKQKDYINQNTMIFSNLFGPILANNSIPEYKLKQSEKIDAIAIEKLYKEYFSTALDIWLGDEPFLDLRAGFYNKFYKTNTKEYITLKFLKNGKVVSHWAKAYRGVVLRELAKNSIQNIDEFIKMEIPRLKIKEIIQIKNQKEISFDIIS